MFADEPALSTMLRYASAPRLDALAQYLANAAAREQLHPSAVVFTERGPALQPLERIAAQEGIVVLNGRADALAWVADFHLLDDPDPRGEFTGVEFKLYQLVLGADVRRAVRQIPISDPLDPHTTFLMRSVDPTSVTNSLRYARTALCDSRTKTQIRAGARVTLEKPEEGLLGEFYTYLAQGWR